MLFGAQFALALVLGRAFCAWLCPAGGLAECALAVSARPARGGRWNWIKYAFWLPWVALVATLLVGAGGIRQVDPLYQTVQGVSVAEPSAYYVYYIVLALILILSLTAGRRAFCPYVCWMAPFMVLGAWIRNRLRWPGLRLHAEASRCSHCQRCSRACTMSLDVHAMVQRGEMHDSECILYGLCVDNCPKGAIRYRWGREWKKNPRNRPQSAIQRDGYEI